MNIPWKLKSFIFSAIDYFHAPNFLYFLQKNVTKRSRVNHLGISPVWDAHKAYLKKYMATETVFEFGAGKTLAQNLYLSDTVTQQIVVDLNEMIDYEYVNNARCQLSKVVDLKSGSEVRSRLNLMEYGIEYLAPFDAAKTNFADKSIDACISTDTLEHIPEESIAAIFKELHRIIRDDGIISARIDYSDHYAHTDRNISLLNFLNYDEHEWTRFNHNCHYQNRLRHYDYTEIFRKCGFCVVEETLVFSANKIPVEIMNAFRGEEDSWSATSAHVVLKKIAS